MRTRYALVVEDSATMRQLIGLSLRRIPALDMLEAEDGSAALEFLARGCVDVILLDLNMPRLGGFGFLERLPEVCSTPPPVIVITTESGEQDVARARELGAMYYVTKPVQAPKLTSLVTSVLEATASADPNVKAS